jgi:hypothetical protein
MRTESTFHNIVFKNKKDTMNFVQKYNICINMQ